MSKDDAAMSAAASRGNLEELRALMQQGVCRPDSKKAQQAMVSAVEAGQLEAVIILLDWGSPVESQDDMRQRALPAACKKGHVAVLQELIKRGADTKVADHEGSKPLDVAVAAKQLGACKLLLKSGAVLGAGQSCKGLAAVVAEVQQEILVETLKGYADTAPDIAQEIEQADTMVAQAQSEHMRLIMLKEEQRAGAILIDREGQLQVESEAHRKMKMSEDAFSRELIELRTNLQSSESASAVMKSQLESSEAACNEAIRCEAEADTEHRAMSAELAKTQKETELAEKSIADKGKGTEDALALAKSLEAEINAMKLRNRGISEELKAESAAMRGWERDKEAAMELTAQAQRLLGVSV